jgi:hypothetical protein
MLSHQNFLHCCQQHLSSINLVPNGHNFCTAALIPIIKELGILIEISFILSATIMIPQIIPDQYVGTSMIWVILLTFVSQSSGLDLDIKPIILQLLVEVKQCRVEVPPEQPLIIRRIEGRSIGC